MPDPQKPKELMPHPVQPYPPLRYPSLYLEPNAPFYQRQPANQQNVPQYFYHDVVALQLHMLQIQAQQQQQQQQQQSSSNANASPATSAAQTSVPPPVPSTIPTAQPPAAPLLLPSTDFPAGATPIIPQPTLAMRPVLPAVPESQMASAYRIGRYTPAERRIRLERYREKRAQRNYNRRVKYDCRKMIADKRRRVQGRFVKREEELALAEQEERQTAVASSSSLLQDSSAPHAEQTDGVDSQTQTQQSSVSPSNTNVDLSTDHVNGHASSGDPETPFCDQSEEHPPSDLPQFR